MRIADTFGRGRPVFSFEFFPPKTPEGVETLYRTVAEDLAPLKPTFVSVTYGAGGSTQDLTVELVSTIKRDLDIEAMCHLTCVGHSAGELAQVLDRLQATASRTCWRSGAIHPAGRSISSGRRTASVMRRSWRASSGRATGFAWAAAAIRRGIPIALIPPRTCGTCGRRSIRARSS